MSGERGSHQPKSRLEREKYWETTVRQKQTPTVDAQEPEFDSTGTLLPVGPDTVPSFQRTRRPKPRSPWLRENGIKALVITAGVGLGGWVLVQLYSLNREVGALQVRVDGTTKQQDKFGTDFDGFKDHVQREIDRIDDRINQLLGDRATRR